MNLETMQRYWSEDADNYGQIIEDELASFRVEAWKKFLSCQLPHRTQDVLDFGCGPGFFSIILADMGYTVTAIDCSAGMLKKASQLVEAANLQDRITFYQMDVNAMTFPENSFDAILSRNVTWTLADPRKVYSDCRQLLRPLGRLMLFDANWHLHLYDEALARKNNKRHEDCLKQFGKDFDGPPLTEPFDPRKLPLSDVKRPYWDVEALRLAGFRNAHSYGDLTEKLWDEKEKLLYGETPLFGIIGDK